MDKRQYDIIRKAYDYIDFYFRKSRRIPWGLREEVLDESKKHYYTCFIFVTMVERQELFFKLKELFTLKDLAKIFEIKNYKKEKDILDYFVMTPVKIIEKKYISYCDNNSSKFNYDVISKIKCIPKKRLRIGESISGNLVEMYEKCDKALLADIVNSYDGFAFTMFK